MTEKQFRIGPKAELADRKVRFAELNEFVSARCGWLTSIPGAVDVEMQCLPGSTLPEELRGLGYEPVEIGETERILPAAIVQRFVIGADGELQPLTEGSTRPVTSTVTHAGICSVKQYGFEMP